MTNLKKYCVSVSINFQKMFSGLALNMGHQGISGFGGGPLSDEFSSGSLLPG